MTRAAEPVHVPLRECICKQDSHGDGSTESLVRSEFSRTGLSAKPAVLRYRGSDIADARSVIPAEAGMTPSAQNASASIAMTESAPALSVASSEAVLGRRRRTKNRAVASFAR